MSLPFKENAYPLTLGVELELQVLDQQTLLLTPRAKEIISAAKNSKLTPEMFQSTLEVVSGVCRDVHEVDRDLTTSMEEILAVSNTLGLTLSSTGTHPLADYRDRLITDKERYHQLIDRNQWLIRRMAVYGMHIHLGMKSGDDCIRFGNFFLHFAPHLIALSASSPFWQKMDTGLMASRPTLYESLPTAGMPYLVKDWREFERLITFLKRSKSIESLKDLWWDVRPSPAIGTVEIRICDEPATRKEILGIVAFVHALAFWFEENQNFWVKQTAPIKRWILRENKWRAIRYGLEASVIVSRTGSTSSIRADLQEWLKRLRPYIDALGYNDYVTNLLSIIEKGNSAQRQRAIMEKHQDGQAVVKHNMQEFLNGTPNWYI